MCRGNAPVLSHFTLTLPMQKASFTFIMPSKFIPCVMPIMFHDNSSIIFCKIMPKTDPSIKFRPWKSIVCIYQLLENELHFRKYPKSYFQNAPQNLDFTARLTLACAIAGIPRFFTNSPLKFSTLRAIPTQFSL